MTVGGLEVGETCKTMDGSGDGAGRCPDHKGFVLRVLRIKDLFSQLVGFKIPVTRQVLWMHQRLPQSPSLEASNQPFYRLLSDF